MKITGHGRFTDPTDLDLLPRGSSREATSSGLTKVKFAVPTVCPSPRLRNTPLALPGNTMAAPTLGGDGRRSRSWLSSTGILKRSFKSLCY